MSTKLNIIRCNATHIDPLAELLGSAFFHDPLYEYVFPDAETRQELSAWELGKLVEYGIRFGEVYATSTLTGCIVCLPPGETDFTETRMNEIGILDSGAVIGEEAESRLMRFVNESEVFHKQVAPDPHWYLVVLGVEPSSQGQGIGSALLATVLARADADKLPAYLETLASGNLNLYKRLGFDMRAEAELSDGGCYVWYMVREPKG